jgi:hypothetical protein
MMCRTAWIWTLAERERPGFFITNSAYRPDGGQKNAGQDGANAEKSWNGPCAAQEGAQKISWTKFLIARPDLLCRKLFRRGLRFLTACAMMISPKGTRKKLPLSLQLSHGDLRIL